jgi:cytochrome P450
MSQILPAIAKYLRPRRDSGGAPVFDFTNSPSRPNTHEFYARARAAGPVCFDVASGEWIVVGYEAVVWAFKNHETLSSKYQSSFDPLVVGNDPPTHTLYRKILARAMAGCDAAMVEAYTCRWMESFIKRTEESGGVFDAVGDLACPLPESFSGLMLGLDEAETQQLISLRPRNRTQLNDSWPGVTSYLEKLVTLGRRAGKRDGVFGALLSLPGSDALSDGEIVGLLRLLWFAGTSTTTHFLPSLLLLMLRHPAAVEEMRSDRSVLLPFINEALRMEGPNGILPRRAETDFELMGVKIPANAMVKISILAANSDPVAFPEPRQIRYNRPRTLVAFGHGIHFCLGAMIAKVMAANVAGTLAARFPAMSAAQPLDSVRYEPSDAFRAINSLQIKLG